MNTNGNHYFKTSATQKKFWNVFIYKLSQALVAWNIPPSFLAFCISSSLFPLFNIFLSISINTYGNNSLHVPPPLILIYRGGNSMPQAPVQIITPQTNKTL